LFFREHENVNKTDIIIKSGLMTEVIDAKIEYWYLFSKSYPLIFTGIKNGNLHQILFPNTYFYS